MLIIEVLYINVQGILGFYNTTMHALPLKSDPVSTRIKEQTSFEWDSLLLRLDGVSHWKEDAPLPYFLSMSQILGEDPCY